MTLAFRIIFGLSLAVALTSCASYQTSMPRVASGIEASKDLWRAVCLPTPPDGLRETCTKAQDGINTVIELYTEVNDAL